VRVCGHRWIVFVAFVGWLTRRLKSRLPSSANEAIQSTLKWSFCCLSYTQSFFRLLMPKSPETGPGVGVFAGSEEL